MVKALLLILSLMAGPALAQDRGAGDYPVVDPEIGEMKIEVKDSSHTWLRLNVTYKCYDKRLRSTGVQPKEQTIPRLTDVVICLHRPRGVGSSGQKAAEYDSVNKLANVRFTRMRFSDSGGPSTCDIHENAIVDLRRLCHAWQPPN